MRNPPEIITDIVIELLAVVSAEVWHMAPAAESAKAREQIEQVHDALNELRFSFNPHDRDEVGATMRMVRGGPTTWRTISYS